MFKVFVCSNGSVYACPCAGETTVDELIEFLEEHRGKVFTNYAADDYCFCIGNNVVACEEFEYALECAADEYSEDYAEYMKDWFDSITPLRGDDSGYTPPDEDDEYDEDDEE